MRKGGEIVERERKRENREKKWGKERNDVITKRAWGNQGKKDMTTKGERNDTMRCERWNDKEIT